MIRLRALIVDDEPLARACICRALRPENQIEVIGECGDGAEAVSAIRRHRPDLVFLDIQLPGMDGFGVLGELAKEEVPAVVFVTAYDAFALRAFEVHAVDYLLKPFEDVRLRRAIEEVRARQSAGELGLLRSRVAALLEDLAPAARAVAEPAGPVPVRRVLVKDADDRARFLRLEEVDWIAAAGNNVRFHAGKESYEVRMTLRVLLPQLDREVFRRIHRSTIVNLNAIREIQPWFAGDCLVLLNDGQRLRMSRSYRDQLMQHLL
ncbi:MAG: LytTR family DNA-binding domain-containing protein [Gemmatimonadota bacterium]|nr:LytTR family DNA-binding domain-containing protein [Gemmatimonadota bacterium]